MKRIFLSSTSHDLFEYRQFVYDIIEGLDNYHCLRMENFGARDSSPQVFDAEKVAECDLFIAIIGYRYGSSPSGKEKSYTELEFETALAQNKPILVFHLESEITPRSFLTESSERQVKQARFRELTKKDRIIQTFNSPPDLAIRVIQAIFNWERQQSSKVALSAPPLSLSTELPVPPKPYFAHPYPLQEHFTGRLHERQMLTEWIIKDHHPILALIGIGGLGKSSLAWVWLNYDVLNQPITGLERRDVSAQSALKISEEYRLDGVLWWSFYETDASFTSFLNDALLYLSSGTLAPDRISSPYSKARSVFTLLQQQRILVVFDGFERLLKAYAGLSGAYQSEDITGARANQPNVVVDPLVGKFIQWIASSPTSSRIVITSRLFPQELEGFGGKPLAGCRKEDLESLDPQDALDFFQKAGVKGTRIEIKSVCEKYGYHALTLRLLVGYITNHIAQPGEIKVASKYNPLDWLIPRKHNILDLAYDALTADEQKLLSSIAAFRSPRDFEAVKALGVFTDDLKLELALRRLLSRNLIFFERIQGRFDLHPIVRRYAYHRLTNKTALHNRLRNFFSAIPTIETSSVRTVEDLASVIELFHHTILAGKYSEAFQLCKDRLLSHLESFGAFRTIIDILETFLCNGNPNSLYLDKSEDQSHLLPALARAYGYTGQTRKAIDLYKLSVKLAEQLNEQASVINNLGNVSYFQLKLGHLTEAIKTQQRAIQISNEGKSISNDAFAFMRLGLMFSYIGWSDKSREELRRAAIELQKQTKIDLCHLWIYRIIRARLLGDVKLALVCAQHSLKLAEGDHRQMLRTKGWLCAVLLDIVDQKKKNIQTHEYRREIESLLIEVLSQCRKFDLLDLETLILSNWARWYMLNGDMIQAENSAREALNISIRCEYRLEQAEIYLFLAKLGQNTGNKEVAVKNARLAKECALCDGLPYVYQLVLENAMAIENYCN